MHFLYLLALRVLLDPETSDEHRRYLYDRFGSDPEVAKGLAKPDAPTPAWLLRRVAADHGSYQIREQLAANPTARRDYETCALLLRTTSASLLAVIAEDTEIAPEHFASIMERLPQLEPGAAANALRYRMREGRPINIRPSCLLPLLNHEDQRVREVAVTCLGQTEKPERASRPPTRRR